MKEIIEDIVREEEEQERLQKEKEELELKLLEKEILLDDEESDENAETEDTSEKQPMLPGSVDLAKLMGVPQGPTGISDNVAEKLQAKAQVSN